MQEDENYKCENGVETITFTNNKAKSHGNNTVVGLDGGHGHPLNDLPPLPYNMITQQYISDKSIADGVEALIGAHLISLGPRPTLKLMNWLGIKVLTEIPTAIFDPLLRFVDTETEVFLSH